MPQYTFFFYVRRYFPATMLSLFAAYWLSVYLFLDYRVVVFMRSAQMTISGSVLFALRRSIYSVFTDDYETIPPDQWPEHVATWGALFFWTGMMLNGAWLLFWELADPMTIDSRMPSNSAVNGFFLMLIIVGGLLKASAPQAIGGQLAHSSRWLLAFALSATIVISVAGMQYSDKIHSIGERIAPQVNVDSKRN